MDNPPVEKPFDDITLEDVYEKVKSQGYIEKTFEDLQSCIKNSTSYIALMKETKQNILGDHFLSTPIGGSKKQRLLELAVLATQFDSSLSEIFGVTLEIEVKPAIEKILKQMSCSKQKGDLFPSSKEGQTTKNNNYEAANDESYEPGSSKNSYDAEDSCDSLSSVHTSELSSWSDDVEVSTKNHDNNETEPKIISFNSVNKAYKSMVEGKKKTPLKRQHSTSKARVSPDSKGSDETDTSPKRKRKPNSKYSLK